MRMNNFLLLPIIIPFFFGMILMFGQKNLMYQRTFSLLGIGISLITAVSLLMKVKHDGIQKVTFGDWPVPYGITMVSDMVSALLVTTTLLIAFFVVWYGFGSITKERERFFYYPGIMFILTGVNGAFTTGDIFNLFVFFEVLLMASYLLIVLGGEKGQLKGSIKYILINVISSALFVITVAFLYSVVGTLNMADIAVKIAEINQPGIITVIAVLFLMVFGLKAAIFPLYFWLPTSYAAAPIPVLTLFGALLTKVGVYAITRTYTLFFVHDLSYTHDLLMVLAIATIVAGCIGALAYFDVKLIIIYNIVIAVGVILFGVSQMNEASLKGAMFYLVHDMLIKAALFMLIGIIIYITGTSDLRKMGGLMKKYPALGWCYLIAAFGLAGIPPLSGFVGKLLIVQGGFEAGNMWSSIFILASSLLVLLSVIRIFIYAFWGEEKETKGIVDKSIYKMLFMPSALLVLISVAYGVGSEWMTPFMDDAAKLLNDPSIYIDAVMKGD
ncbi:multisubunit sodium/proton antiporter, MrpD subunit [Lysinibacillus fusiformis]|uniref:Multisubunit sodium/proton antiporter, MrpD subunit n=2 Tax=Bacillaceae TaxID=186817 RepID=A0A1H9J8F9_9BACI|nr:multisubunit sodium/proton antiporter, MrpD subunit [Lysinibacillus fusiformis]SCY45258.1 multisubunit sodium/proton antiporter, MrpD subunit [Lysinibacillus fusiformis]SDB59202.1 multisubunit sodium/proton antiporter, MrpD subunit [Lysinibacillus fusiformis]SEN71973.1 multisubunit sodium/proton antiporter, MrpD subunit [Lysinibacillus fusiformis]SEQ83092.1 multisubunit sodium/proton antiporter, MrpD subunit [Lysinibacillus fusiformis]